jgi:ankyrin repeat protein
VAATRDNVDRSKSRLCFFFLLLLFLSCSPKLLLDEGADVSAEGGRHGNALQAASFRGHVETVELLLKKGADVNAQGGRYGNALAAASVEGHDEIVEMLLAEGRTSTRRVATSATLYRPPLLEAIST